MKKTWHRVLIVVVIGVMIFIGFFMNTKEKTVVTPVFNENNPVITGVIVEIKGEVKKPGLYVLDSESRVNDLVILAGGFTGQADTTNLNLAAKLSDGIVIYVNAKTKEKKTNKISINTASIEELMKLPNIGESRAKNIIDYRNKYGKFNSLEDLVNVNGISKNILDQIKEFICI
ncbi:MAG: ComEA family DNA-binding protein [Bacilli bacterium]|nr:ComEA family DNA-binding protein [Bacilli bacterium]MDD4076504.1 ComEA family DNA-binding protein [Bacilli bacterium]MDD4387616.1 ComEA family DNA-binding protein [Bacilli bacterium]